MPEPTTKPRRTRRPQVSQVSLTPLPRSGEMPLQYLLRLMRDETASPARRDRAAAIAAPYCHQRLAEKTKRAQDAEAAREIGGGDSEWGDDLRSDDGLLRQ
jgi:hypothetical protein